MHVRPTIGTLSIQRFLGCECGATAIEYGLIMALVFLAIVGSVGALGKSVMDVLYNKLQTMF
jgi:Flp pilus assembly pilin Flp